MACQNVGSSLHSVILRARAPGGPFNPEVGAKTRPSRERVEANQSETRWLATNAQIVSFAAWLQEQGHVTPCCLCVRTVPSRYVASVVLLMISIGHLRRLRSTFRSLTGRVFKSAPRVKRQFLRGRGAPSARIQNGVSVTRFLADTEGPRSGTRRWVAAEESPSAVRGGA
jgi:hypothetical protein